MIVGDSMFSARKIAIGVAVCMAIVLAALVNLWCNRTEHTLCLCTRCGARVVTRQHFFAMGFAMHAPPYPEGYTSISTQPSILSEIFNVVGECSHGVRVAGAPNEDDSQIPKNCLIPLDSYVDSPLKRFGCYSHTTWIGIECSCFLLPGDHAAVWNANQDREEFRKYLLHRKQNDPEFLEKLRQGLQSKSPVAYVKSLLADFQNDVTPSILPNSPPAGGSP